MDRLKNAGFTDAMINRFFRPFMSGIFFNPALTTSSRLFNFVMRMLATGQNCLPSKGIGEVAAQLERGLPSGSVRLHAGVVGAVGELGGGGGGDDEGVGGSSSSRQISLQGGGVVTAKRAVVVAVEGPAAKTLLGEPLNVSPSARGAAVGTTCLYFAIDGPAPLPCPILYLNGDGPGLVNNCCFPSTVSSSYAPAGMSLASVSIVGVPDMTDEELEAAVRGELETWFGGSATGGAGASGAQPVSEWRHLRTYRIPFAQPNQITPTDLYRPVSLGKGLYVCGDHRSPATYDGAMLSGRLAAEAVIAAL
jgi:hypothetical protein